MTSPDAPEAVEPPISIIVYICPTKGCGNHYSAPDFRPDRADIEAMQYHRSQNDGTQEPSHTRLECPACRTARSIHVERVPHVVTQVVPLEPFLPNKEKKA